MTIGLDIDGVLANFAEGYERKIVEVTGRNLFDPDRGRVGVDWHPPVWDWPQLAGYTGEEISRVWREIAGRSNFWTNLTKTAEANYLVEAATMSNSALYMITDRPGPFTQGATRGWFESMFGLSPAVIVTQGVSKGRIAKALSLDVMLDDKWENIRSIMDVSPNTQAVLLARPYNSNGHSRASNIVRSGTEFVERFLER